MSTIKTTGIGGLRSISEITIGAVIAAACQVMVEPLLIDRGAGPRAQDLEMMDTETGISLGALRVYEKSVQLLMPSRWPKRPTNDRGEAWLHWDPAAEPVTALKEEVVTLLLDARRQREEAT